VMVQTPDYAGTQSTRQRAVRRQRATAQSAPVPENT
jgi:hypothetical protein